MIRLRPTRLLAIGALVLVGLFYWKPAHSYMRTKKELDARRAQVQQLRDEKALLEKRIQLATSGTQLVRQARLLGLVKPNEHLFIVRGISAWRHRNH